MVSVDLSCEDVPSVVQLEHKPVKAAHSLKTYAEKFSNDSTLTCNDEQVVVGMAKHTALGPGAEEARQLTSGEQEEDDEGGFVSITHSVDHFKWVLHI